MPARKYGNQVEVLLGSDSDLPLLANSKLFEVFAHCQISSGIHTNSADRHPVAVNEHCSEAVRSGTKIFIAAAGMTNVLASAIASAFTYTIPVIAVALPGGRFETDSLYSVVSKPDGCPLIPVLSFTNAAILAAQLLAVSDKLLKAQLLAYQEISFDQKKPVYSLDIPKIRADLKAKEKQ